MRALRRPGFCVVLAITRTKGNEILTGRVRRSIATGIKKTNLLDPIANSRERERERERLRGSFESALIGLRSEVFWTSPIFDLTTSSML